MHNNEQAVTNTLISHLIFRTEAYPMCLSKSTTVYSDELLVYVLKTRHVLKEVLR